MSDGVEQWSDGAHTLITLGTEFEWSRLAVALGHMAKGNLPRETNPTNAGMSWIRTHSLDVLSAVP